LRDRQLTLNPQLTAALLGMVDAVRQMLGSIEVSGAEGELRRQAVDCHADPPAAVARSAGEKRSCRCAGT
jgi:hypothetical protein